MSYVEPTSGLWDDITDKAKEYYNTASDTLSKAQKVQAAASAAKAEYTGGGTTVKLAPSAPSSGGLGGIPTWALLGGVGLVAMFVLKRR